MAIPYKSKFEGGWIDVAEQGMMNNLTGDWRSIRPVLDKAPCRKCGWCSLICPVGCITQAEDGYFYPDYDYCKGCGICMCECPANALHMAKEEIE